MSYAVRWLKRGKDQRPERAFPIIVLFLWEVEAETEVVKNKKVIKGLKRQIGYNPH